MAEDLLGVITAATRKVVAFAPQPAHASGLLGRTGAELTRIEDTGDFTLINISVEREAARGLLDELSGDPAKVPDAQTLRLDLTLPGRTSLHDRGETTWCVDTAISPPGITAVISFADQHLRRGYRMAVVQNSGHFLLAPYPQVCCRPLE